MLHDAWIVGNLSEHGEARDWDVLVSFTNWKEAAALVPVDAKPNSFGGWKFIEEGFAIDVWPGDMAWLMTNEKFKTAWHPKTNRKIFVR